MWPVLYTTAPARLPNAYPDVERSGARNRPKNHAQLPPVICMAHTVAARIAIASARIHRTVQANSLSRTILLVSHAAVWPDHLVAVDVVRPHRGHPAIGQPH